MTDWKQADWADVPHMSHAEARLKAANGARIICDRQTFDEVIMMHEHLAAQGCDDDEIEAAVNAFLAAKKKALH